jgi:medium-chain acyl-[acyl-carrier-protein] hydrolase
LKYESEMSMTKQIQKMRTLNPWLRCWERRPHAHMRLFCFPYAGGGASIFHRWAEYLPQNVEVCAVQLPGREDRLPEQAFSTMSSLLEALIPVLTPYLDMPYAFFGHSMGGLISFELARYFCQTDESPAPFHLFVSGRSAPQLPDLEPPSHDLPEPEFIEELRRLKGTPEKILQNAELLRLLLPLLRADFSLCETYRYTQGKPIPCPISAFGGLYDLDVTREAIGAWRTQTSEQFKMRFFDGDHFFIHKEQTSLLQSLTRDLFSGLVSEIGVIGS